jgi:hypothetical protein
LDLLSPLVSARCSCLAYPCIDTPSSFVVYGSFYPFPSAVPVSLRFHPLRTLAQNFNVVLCSVVMLVSRRGHLERWQGGSSSSRRQFKETSSYLVRVPTCESPFSRITFTPGG